MDAIGKVSPPPGIWATPIVDSTGKLTGLIGLSNTLLKLVFIVAGLYALINIILAGFAFMSAGGDSKGVAKAWEKIYMTLLGLTVIVCSFLLAAIIGILLFGNAMAILNPTIEP